MSSESPVSIILSSFGQFWTEETGQNRFYPVFPKKQVLDGRNPTLGSALAQVMACCLSENEIPLFYCHFCRADSRFAPSQ